MSRHLPKEKQLFDGALDIDDPARRQAFLERACKGEPELRRRVETLLTAGEAAGDFFNFTPFDTSSSASTGSGSPRTGDGALQPAAGLRGREEFITQIGRYRLLERIGEGGYGVVYRAEQQEPVKRQAALKIIRLGMDTEKVISRFEAERQALALMEHPYIARVLDAGATDSGRPFFVMELVGGVKITDYCDRHRLDLKRRLRLFIKVCNAVQHAHQKGVIHRDIKPSNILVTDLDGEPIPKVIDFGIAKATEYRLTEHTLCTTDMGQFVGTPAYMSPEHAELGGLNLDTRSDIYSLGVLLCELLAGDLPFATRDWSASDPEQIRQGLRAREARRPSQVFSALPEARRLAVAEQRQSPSARLPGQLKGDLDWITLKALAADRDHRYESASALAADVQRHLDHDVVTARPPSRMYQVRRFVRRNKGPVIASGLVVAALVAGLAASTRLYIREQRALRQTEEARANEAALRLRAEAGERMAKAAVQISYQRIEEADALVEDIPLELVQPSLESSLVYKTLGTWHAQAGRWTSAARYLEALADSITTIDPTDTDTVSFQLIPAATVIVESGDYAKYEQFRQVLLARFGGTAKPIVAEQILKSTLLLPADPDTLATLQPLYAMVEEAIHAPGAEKDSYMVAWRSFALGLMDYRRGDYERALRWAGRSLASDNVHEARLTAASFLAAMSHHHLGHAEQAAEARRKGEEMMAAHETEADAPQKKLGGFWFDWINCRILQREAARLMPPAPEQPVSP